MATRTDAGGLETTAASQLAQNAIPVLAIAAFGVFAVRFLPAIVAGVTPFARDFSQKALKSLAMGTLKKVVGL